MSAGNAAAVGLREPRKIRFRTTLLELFAGLIERTHDDAAAIARAHQVFATHEVRLERTHAALRLLVEPATAPSPSKRAAKHSSRSKRA